MLIDPTFTLRKVRRVHLQCTNVLTGAPYAYDGHAAAVLPVETNKRGQLVRPVAIDPMSLAYCAPEDVQVYVVPGADWPTPIGPVDPRIRTAVVIGTPSVGEVSAYMPRNYRAAWDGEHVRIIGRDVAGWTLDEYVIPRLASGLIFARETTS